MYNTLKHFLTKRIKRKAHFLRNDVDERYVTLHTLHKARTAIGST